MDYSFVRFTSVFANSEELELADEPMLSDINDLKIIDDDVVDEYELDGLYSELKSGRWLIISGERTDIKERGITVPGVEASELVMLAGVYHRPSPGPDGRLHTFIKLAKRLEYSYKRDTVKIYANVVKADHGETRKEILGSGDSTKEFQSFPLRQPPLTYVAATTPDGTDSTLRVMVNDIQWRESETLAELSSSDRKFITRSDDEGNTTIIFGNGKNGARLPSGAENIRATYRSGIGAAGNVKPDQISQLMAKPLGVREVINPFGATGGADKESRDLVRRNAPLSITALDRLVSTRDYADFASTFAGIGKSHAVRLTDGAREIVHLTIAGADDIPIDDSSDLFQSLNQALRQFGDPL
jgi:predicted phage baseplate assembly protein